MKVKRTVKIVVAILAVFGTMLAMSQPASAWEFPYGGMGTNECVVKSPYWGTMQDHSVTTLGVAMAYANSTKQACKKRILVQPSSGTINMTYPLIIGSRAMGDHVLINKTERRGVEIVGQEGSYYQISGVAACAAAPATDGDGTLIYDGEDAGECGFEAGEKDYQRRVITLDASAMKAWTDGDGNEVDCAIQIDSDAVKLSNIKIKGVPAGKNAICVNGSNNVLDHVWVVGVGGDAFVFGDNATDNFIMPNCGASGSIGGKVIRINNASEAHGNRFIPTNRYITGGTDVDGFASLENMQTMDELLLASTATSAAGAVNMKMKTNDTNNFIATKFNTSVRLYSVQASTADYPVRNEDGTVQVDADGNQITETKEVVFIHGAVIKWPSDQEVPSGPQGLDSEFCTADMVKNVAKLQVYNINNHVPGFLGYVAGMSEASGMGLIDLGDMNGEFMINVPKDGQQILIVPELTGNSIARSSQVINVADDMSQVQCEGGGFGAPTGGTNGNPGNRLNRKRFMSKYECLKKRNLLIGTSATGIQAPGYDTDGDNIPDDREDTNRNCDCTDDTTCWYMADTDGDGLHDGVDPVPDNDDQDNDNLKDGAEDRNQLVYATNPSGTRAAKNYLYTFESYDSMYPVPDANGNPIECQLGSMDDIGVRYVWFKLDAGGNPVDEDRRAFASSAQNSYDIEIFACKNQMLANPANFDGDRDEDNAELDMTDADSDGDGWCDGNGSGCANASQSNDACPLIANTVGNTCGGQYPCTPKLMFYTIDPRYVVFDEGIPVSLRDSGKVVTGYDETGAVIEAEAGDGSPMGADGVPDIFQVTGGYLGIASLAGDTDQDGIPDVVENPSGACTGDCGSAIGQSGSDVSLRHYCEDSDGDGYSDGWKSTEATSGSDVCPITAGPGRDGFDATASNYSCPNPRELYVGRKILAFFLDRDGDGLRDGLEDRNQDGKFNNKVLGLKGVEGVAEVLDAEVLAAAGVSEVTPTESDALDPDSDGDGITDFVEVTGWPYPTNPADEDTDDDDLLDLEENFDGIDEINFQIHQGAEGCPQIGTHDTHPLLRDSDGDSLYDGVEIDADGTIDLIIGTEFLARILEEGALSSGIPMISDPTIKDSDKDGLDDDKEYEGGLIKYFNSNPCMRDSDNDSEEDDEENPGCRLNEDPTCIGSADGSTSGGIDSDEDGLPNSLEDINGNGIVDAGETDPMNEDTDGDGVWDGKNPADDTGEDVNLNGIYEPHLGESDPLNADTDGDSITDGYELRYGTDPTNIDSDGDCIPDGPMMVPGPDGQLIQSTGEDANQNGIFDMGVETNALSSDTDGDGLPDGWVASSGTGEDLNCDGVRNVREGGQYSETDGRNPDSDMDGIPDMDEMMSGGYFNLANIGRATSGQEGCSLVGSASGAPTSMFYLMGLLLGLTKLVSRRKREKTSA